MTLLLLAYLGGVLTIVSPCILPVLPFVFARSDRPFVRSGLPLLVGMAATFAAAATLAALGGGWAVQANEYGRYAAIALLALFGVTLLFPALSDRLTRPLVALGARLSEAADQQGERGGVISSLLLGVATGLLWAPCAELYAYARQWAEAEGWLFGGAIAGHIVGEFPHAHIPGDKALYRIGPGNPTRMRDPDARGQTKFWILEVHLVDPERTFGGFYERLLVPG